MRPAQEVITYIPVGCESTECPLYGTRNCVSGSVHRPAHSESLALQPESEGYSIGVAFVGSMPTAQEARAKTPFTGDANTIIRKAIALNTPQGGHALLPVMRCTVPDSVPPEEREAVRLSAMAHCRPYLERDLRNLNPKVVVLLGTEPVQSLLGLPTATGHYGHVRKTKLGERATTTVVSLSSEAVFKQPAALSYLLQTFDKATDLAQLGNRSMYNPMRWKSEPEINYCDTVRKVEDLVEFLLNGTEADQVCAFDVETMNLNTRYGNKLVMLQFCVTPFEVWCVPYHYIHAPFDQQDLQRIKAALKRLFTSTPKFGSWVGHGVTFDLMQVMEHITDGLTVTNRPILDTQAEIFLLDENRVDLGDSYGINFKLKTCSKEFLGRDVYDSETLQEREDGSLFKLEPAKLCAYAGNDVVNTILLHNYCSMVAESQDFLEQMTRLTIWLFSGAIRLTASLRRNGLAIDLEHLRMLVGADSPILGRMEQIKNELRGLDVVKRANLALVKEQQAGQKLIYKVPWVFDLDKSDHRLELFINQLELRPLKRGKPKPDGSPGTPSMDDDFWERYKDTCHETGLAQEYFGLKKLATSYANKILGFVDPQYGKVDTCTDSRVRSNFYLTGTVTGRTASFDPAVQTFPKAKNYASAAIKSMVVAPQSNGRPVRKGSADKVDTVLLQADYIGAEIKIWGLLSKDKVLTGVLRRGTELRAEYRKNPSPELKKRAKLEGDVHRDAGSKMFQKPLNEVTDDDRQNSKSISLGLMFGRGVRAIAEQLKNPDLDQVQERCDQFSEAYETGVSWFYKQEDYAQRRFYVESDLGRRRRLFAALGFDPRADRDHPYRSFAADARRQARNSPIQSESSDFGLMGSTLFLDYVEKEGKNWKLVNFVHDSAVVEVPLAELREAARILDECFTTRLMAYCKLHWGMEFLCPLEVEFEFGVRWGEMEKFDGTDADFERLVRWLEAGGVKDFPK